MVAVVNHLSGHTAVDAYILACHYCYLVLIFHFFLYSANEFLHILICWYYIEAPRENASFRALVFLMSPFSLTPLTSIFPLSSRWK